MVTGGAGFAGSHLTEYLIGLGWEVTVLAAEREDLGNISAVLDRIHVVRGDLRDAPSLRSIVASVEPDRVYHLAALPSPLDSVSNPGITYEVNFLGTLNLLLACRELARAPRFLFVSSSEVYGPLPPQAMPLRESAPLRPANPYAASKAAGEMLVYQFWRCYEFPAVIVRPFNHTGPRQTSNFVCSDFARQVAEIQLGLRPPRITVGNLKVQRDFTDVRDIVRGYHLLVEKGTDGEVYHLGSGKPVEIEAVLQILLGECSKKVEVVVDPARVRHGEAAARWGDTEKAMKTVGWKRTYLLQDTLRDLVEYWKARLGTTGSEVA
jgi:GDP-4-dehydro-6-deoxy-D-mannose reductase